MSLSDATLRKISNSDVSLTLFNESGDRYTAGPMRTFTRINRGIKMSWPIVGNPITGEPFTYAALHVDDKVLEVVSVNDVTNFEGSELELCL